MKLLSVILISLTILTSIAQAEWENSEAGRQLYLEKHGGPNVDSCPRSQFSHCPRKPNDFYAEFAEIVKNGKLKSALDNTEVERMKVNVTFAVEDRGLLLSIGELISKLNQSFARRKIQLTTEQFVSEMLKDGRISSTATFNAIVRLIEATELQTTP